jgi:hypothetical protein
LVREVTKNAAVTLTELQSSRRTTRRTTKDKPDGCHFLVKRHMAAHLEFDQKAPKGLSETR